VKEEEFTLFFLLGCFLRSVYLSLLYYLYSQGYWLTAILSSHLSYFYSVIALLFTGPIWQWFGRRGIKNPWSRKKRSKNIIARFPDPETSSGQALYFMAHYDSKNQSLSLGGRILLVSATVAGCLLLALTYLLRVTAVHDGIFLVIIVSIVILFLNRTDNLSPGGIDNAGSVGLLLELAEILSKNPPKN